MTLHMTDDVPDILEARWNHLMSIITPEMQRALKREAYMRLGNLADVQSVINEVLIKAVIHYDKLKDESQLYTWLITITRRESLTRISRFSIRSFINKACLLIGLIGLPVENWEQLITDREKKRLLNALEELDDESRKIVVLKSTTDLSLNEIAKSLHLNCYTTRSKYQQALEALSDMIQEDAPDECY